MAQPDLTTLAKRLLVRRKLPNSPWYYVSQNWRRQLLFLAAYVAIPVTCWYLDPTLAVAIGCFFAGTKIRDVRWWITLSKQWPTTAELLDWEKIETIAYGTRHA